jgi:hypothetical protein
MCVLFFSHDQPIAVYWFNYPVTQWLNENKSIGCSGVKIKQYIIYMQ